MTVPLVLEAAGTLTRVELSTVDTRFDVRGDQGPPPDVVLVAFDDVTFDELGVQWPFERKLHAKAIDELRRAGARSIAYDVQFTEDERGHRGGHRERQRAVRGRQEGGQRRALDHRGRRGRDDARARRWRGAQGGRGTAGSTVYETDIDGRIRQVGFNQDGLESFPLAAVRVARGRPVDLPEGNERAGSTSQAGPARCRPSRSAPCSNGKLPKDAVRGKIVVVGSTATSLQDLHRTATSGDKLMPGPEIQANSIQTVLDGFPLREAPSVAERPVRGRARRARSAGRVALAHGARHRRWPDRARGVRLRSRNSRSRTGRSCTVVYPLVAAVAGLLATGAIHGVTVAFEREQARDAFARFVPEAVVDQVLADADGVRLGGVRGEATVMFSDLRGFTIFSETLEPERVIESLNMYLTQMSEAILDHGGTLVAYMGDGIMAVFGAPLKQEDHADRALEAARDMLSRMDGFNGWLREQGLHDGFKMGIGLNSGPVMSGNVGSERRLEYTALGDTTNTAARLEGMTKGTPHQLYISDTTRQALTRPVDDIVEVGEAEVRGRKAKVKLWSLRDGDAPAPAPASNEPVAERT